MMETTLKNLLLSVVSDNDAKILSSQFNNLIYKNKYYMNREDMYDIVQDAIMYNLQNDHEITAAGLNKKVRYLIINFVKRKNIIKFESLDELLDAEKLEQL